MLSGVFFFFWFFSLIFPHVLLTHPRCMSVVTGEMGGGGGYVCAALF